MNATPRAVNAVFAFPMNPQQRIARPAIEMDANNAGGGLQPVPGRSEILAPSPFSRKEQDCDAATSATSNTVGLSGGVKRRLCDGRVVSGEEQGGPTANKRHRRETRATRLAGVAVTAPTAAAVMNSNNSYSPALLRAHMTPQLQAPPHQHLHQYQHHQRVLAPMQKTVTPYQAISATGGQRRMREKCDGVKGGLGGVDGGGDEDSWDKRPSSPSTTLWRLDEGDSSSPPSSSSPSSSPLDDGAAESTTIGKKRLEEETTTTATVSENNIF